MKTSKSIIISLLLILSTYFAIAQNTKADAILTAAKLDSLIDSCLKSSGMVGLGAAIIIDKEVVWMKGFGYADKENKVPFTTETIMNIGSISKTVTGACIMKAVEEKKLSLDEDINTYLPFKVQNPYFPNEKITLRSLATHTSGITDREPVYDSTYYYGGDYPEPLGIFLKSYFDPKGKFYSKDNFLNHKPGTYREYSNIGAGLAGYIVERVTGKMLNKYSERYLFKPLGMTNTGWFLSEINQAKHSKLYDKQGDTLKIIPLYGGATYPDGGVRTSVSDLSKFFIALLNDGVYNGKRILKKTSVDDMEKYQFTTSNKPENVNLSKLNSGIFWATKYSGRKIGHGGTDPGVKTEMLSDLSKQVAVVIFTNTTLTDKNMFKYFVPIYDALCEYGITLKDLKNRQ